MKKALIVLLVILLLLGAGAAYVVSNLSTLVARFQPEIEKDLSAKLGVPIKLGKLEVSVFPSTEFSTKAFRLGEGIEVASIAAEVSLKELLNKKLAIQSLRIESPKLTLVKTPSGFGIKGMPEKTAEKSEKTQPTAPKPGASNAKEDFSAPLDVQLSSFSIRNGTVSVEGLPQLSPLIVENTNFSTALDVAGETVVAKNSSLEAVARGLTPITMHIPEASIKGSQVTLQESLLTLVDQRIQLAGSFDINSKNGKGSGRIESFDLKSLQQLATAVPALAKFAPEGTFKTNIEIGFNGSNPPSIEGMALLQNIGMDLPILKIQRVAGEIQFKGNANDLRTEIKDLHLTVATSDATKFENLTGNGKIQTTSNSFDLSEFVLHGFGGTVSASAKSDFALKNLSTGASLQSLSIPNLMAIFVPAVPSLTGKINSVNLTLRTKGEEGPLPGRLSGPISATVSDVTVPKLKIIQPIIKALEAIPSLGALGVANANLSPQQTLALQAGETSFSSIVASLALDGNGNLLISDLTGEAGLFTLKGRGQASMAGALSLDAEVALSESLSTYIISRSSGLKYAANRDGRIVVPVVIAKSADGFSVLPNVQKIIEVAASRGLVEQAGKALNKTLGNKLGGVLGGFLR